MIVLIRHGEAEHNTQELFDSNIDSKSKLTEEGVQQIIDTTNILRDLFKKKYYKVNRIFCSPLIRTIESAKIFKDVMEDGKLYKDDRFCIDYRLREIEMGDFEGRKYNEYPDDRYNFDNNNKYGGESTSDVQERCDNFVRETHGEVFRRIVYRKTGQDWTPIKGQSVIIEDVCENIIFNTNDNGWTK